MFRPLSNRRIQLLALSVWIGAGLLTSGCDNGASPEYDVGIMDATLDSEPIDSGDGATGADVRDVGASPMMTLRITELMAKNDGAWLDEHGEADDWIEVENFSDEFVDLSAFALSDSMEAQHPLPRVLLEPREVRLFWADGHLTQGEFHLPFKLKSSGETIYLWQDDALIETISFPQLAANESYRRLSDGDWARCSWSSPGRVNPDLCGPAPATGVGVNDVFEPYTWSDPWPFPPTPLVITELALHQPGFIEVLNSSDELVDLTTYTLQVNAHHPGTPFPDRAAPGALPWPADASTLAPGARIAISVDGAVSDQLAANGFEGVVSLWSDALNFHVDRVDFMAWPEGTTLARQPDVFGSHTLCTQRTPGAANDACEPLASRPIGSRLRHLRTPGDFAALAAGDTSVGTASVKFVIDTEGGNVTHLLSTARWDLHYTFVREVIEGLAPLNRCDPEEASVFRAGWIAFSERNYVQTAGRRYLNGTLTRYGSNGLRTIEFASGDRATADQWKTAFFTAAARTPEPQSYSIRPRTAQQVDTLRNIEGEVPIVGRLTPFEGVRYQPLTQTVGYGVLTYVPVSELEQTALGPQVIVITDEVPNDIQLVGGLITEAFQTPLAHVNLLSRNRDTPNMALFDARNHEQIAPFLGQLVRLEVSGAGFTVNAASTEEAEAFWSSRGPTGDPRSPRLDTDLRDITPLAEAQIDQVGSLGAKAAQLAHLQELSMNGDTCSTRFDTPANPMAIPLVHSLEHALASGASALLAALRDDPEFRTDPLVRAAGLEEVRALIESHPVEPLLLEAVTDYVLTHFGEARVRFRSSSNTEDLPGFNGAGLYTSISAEIGDEERQIEDAIRTVWASLYLLRAYDERRYHNIEESQVAMGILVHPAFLSEEANGVGISRNILQPTRRQSYLNVQRGEASVANPAHGITTDQVVYDQYYDPEIRYLARSNLAPDGPVLTNDEVRHVACVLRGIQDHFRPALDPHGENRWFAMDIEFKLVGPERQLVVKQARPYSFGAVEVPADCREL